MTSSTEITTILRQYLISQSGLDGQFVRDATTQYGAYLDMNVTNDVFASITPLNTILFFELKTKESSSNMTETDDDEEETIFSINSYQVHITTYGEFSNDVCNKLIARLRTEKVRNELLSKNLYIEHISDVVQLNEFKNASVWQRNDFDIDIACEFKFTQTSLDSQFESVDVTISEKENQ